MRLRKDLNIINQWGFFRRLSTLSRTITSRWSGGIDRPKGIGCSRIFNEDKGRFWGFDINGTNIKDTVGDRWANWLSKGKETN